MSAKPQTVRNVRHATPPTASRCSGFTLIELLAVIVIISMLLGIAVTAAQWVFRTARVKRYEMTCRVLEVAINRYRHEYRRWPIPNPETDINSDYVFRVSGENNAECLHMLNRNHADNVSGIQFLDENGIFVTKKVGGRDTVMTLAAAGSDEPYPFVYRDKRNQMKYFTVEISVDAEKVKVY